VQVRKSSTHLAVAAALIAMAPAATPVADAAVPKTGTWRGDLAHAQHASKEARDVHVNSGMEDGLQDALDLLEQVAVSLR
jgi:hypothetical protein